ncbi:MAG TPA: serine--tRNA ligase [bacterium]|nr:serine--tRNA ligase [bacterium]HPG45019.1 serine--tRNA ligase [bacterium]HPM97261.1 serine--tRNA ligase [bacterium]
MLDLKFIRENAELVRQAIANKHEKADLDALLQLDNRRRELIAQVENGRAEQNRITLQIAELKKTKQDASPIIARMRQFSESIKQLDAELDSVQEQIHAIQIRIPNIPHASAPIGDASHNTIVKTWSDPVTLDFPAKPHWEIAENLDIIDFGRAAKVSGANFVCYKGAGARLERALVNFMLDLHVQKQGYTEIFPPFVTRRQAMFGTGQLPKLEEDMYHIPGDDLFLIPTAEVPVTNLHSDEIIDSVRLPIRYTAYSPCFRREAGAYGKDTRGLMRVHQFNKVEMVKFVTPESSYDEHEKLLQNAEEVLQLLKLPYRVLNLATGDLSFAAAKCYDIEIWAAGIQKWLEVSSCSNFEDFQARRANIRFRRQKGDKPEFVHTLNASGVAMPRTMIAILENNQLPDGSVVVPEVLRPFMGCDKIQ